MADESTRHVPEHRLRALAGAIGQTTVDEMEHLIRCAECRARVLDLVRSGRAGDLPLAEAEAAALLGELLILPADERAKAVRNEARYWTSELAAHALERCRSAVARDPALALELARLGRAIARAAAAGGLEPYALACEGDALRAMGELQRAADALAGARRREAREGGDPQLAARTDTLEARLRRDLGQPEEALALLARAADSFLEIGERDLGAQAALDRAGLHLATGDPEQAAATLRAALHLPRSARLALAVRHELVFALAAAGRAREAAELYAASRGLYLQEPEPLAAGQRLWAEGLIARELGDDLEKAGDLLTEAAARLAEHGHPFDAALAGLDLVAVYVKQREPDQALRVAAELVKLFKVRRIHPEALAALTEVHRAAERRKVDPALLARAAERVRFASRVRRRELGDDGRPPRPVSR